MNAFDIKQVVHRISNIDHDSFFNSLAVSLSEVINASYVLIGKVSEDRKKIHTISLAAKHKLVDNICYDLENTPCEDVSCGRVTTYKDSVRTLFPKDQLAKDLSVEGYVGIPLTNSKGVVDAILVALFENPIHEPENVVSFFSLFTGLIQKEIENDSYIEQLDFTNKIIEGSQEAIFVCNDKVEIIYANKALLKLTGFNREQVIGNNPRIFSSGRQNKEFYRDMWFQINKFGKWSGEITNKRSDGQIYTELLLINVLENEGKKYFVAFILDITEKKLAERKIYFHANHDQLTGITNRFYFNEKLATHIKAFHHQNDHGSANKKEQLAVIYFDIDRFNELNTTYGLSLGDKVLVHLVKRIAPLFTTDVFSRIDGDSFAVLLNYHELAEVTHQVKLINKALAEPFDIDGLNIIVAVSFGISTYQAQYTDISSDGISIVGKRLLRQAELAMFNAKDLSNANMLMFDQSMEDSVKQRHMLIEDLRQAIFEEKLEVYFQPIMDLSQQKITKFESLVRWNNHGEWISPAEFIPLAEESGLIISLGELVLKLVCQQMKQLLKAGYHDIVININRSLYEFSSIKENNNAWLKTINLNGVSPRNIAFELTESVLAPENTNHIQLLKELQNAGCEIALDDFGTGYSSLSYLRRFPVNFLKIDKSFIDEVHLNVEAETLVKSIVQMSKALGIKVVAEGVEHKAQLKVLILLGCDYIQGYYFSKPVASDDVLSTLEQDYLPLF